MPWYDEDDYDEEDWRNSFSWQIGYDPETHTWTCPCYEFRIKGRCFHVRFYRRTVKVDVLEEYL